MVSLPHRGQRRVARPYGLAGGGYVRSGPPGPLVMGDVLVADAVMVGAQPPILPLVVPRTGGFAAARLSPADGSCGVHPYPCYHPGIDAEGAQGTVVNAPEDGSVVLMADGSQPPWVGYGPYLVLILGKSGYYHLLAHLQPGSVIPNVGDPVTAGQPVATTSSANHTHWEVRLKVTPDYSINETNLDNNIDPVVDWLPIAQLGVSRTTALLILGGGVAVALAIYLRRKGR